MTSLTERLDAAGIDVGGRLDRLAAGLSERLAAATPQEHEHDASAVLASLKATGATSMLVPTTCGGGGARAVDAIRFQVGLGAVAPSAAVATTMHHYKLAALGNVATNGDASAQAILRDIASRSALVASGGAESTPGRDLRTLGSHAVRTSTGYAVTGRKRPCSLSTSMDVLSLMVELRDASGTATGFAQAFVDARSPGIEREPFWRSTVLLAAESHAVRLDEVHVPSSKVFALSGDSGARFATDCYVWFQLLISAAYLGIAHCVASATPGPRRAGSARWRDAVAGLADLEDAVVAAARTVDDGMPPHEQLRAAVRARDRVEDEVAELGGRLLRAAGGGTFASTGLFTELTGALNAIAFHPPARGARDGIGLELLDDESRGRA